MSRLWKRVGLSLMVVLFLLVFTVRLWSSFTPSDAKSQRDALPSAKVEQVQHRSMSRWLTTSGVVRAKRRALLTFQQPGRVAFVAKSRAGEELRPGMKVQGPTKNRRGQLLARLDTRENWATIRALRASIRTNRQGWAETRWLVRQALLQKKQAIRQQQRSSRLFAKRALSRVIWEQVRSQYKLASLQYQSVLAKRKTQRAAMAVQRQQLRQLTLNLEKAELRAPFDGVIAAMNLHKNQLTGGDSHATLLVVDPSQYEVKAYLPVDEALRVKPGQDAVVTFSVPQGTKQNYEAKANIKAVSTAVLPKQGLVEVIAAIAPEHRWLRDGMRVSVRIKVGHKSDTLSVPAVAILYGDKSKEVFVLSQRGRCVQRRVVQLGWRSSLHWEVRGGLAEGEWVVTKGKHRLYQGACIHPIRQQ